MNIFTAYLACILIVNCSRSYIMFSVYRVLLDDYINIHAEVPQIALINVQLYRRFLFKLLFFIWVERMRQLLSLRKFAPTFLQTISPRLEFA